MVKSKVKGHLAAKKKGDKVWSPTVHFWSVLALAVQRVSKDSPHKLKLDFTRIEVPVGPETVLVSLWFPPRYDEKLWTSPQGGQKTVPTSEPAPITASNTTPKVADAKTTLTGPANSNTNKLSWARALTNTPSTIPENSTNPHVSCMRVCMMKVSADNAADGGAGLSEENQVSPWQEVEQALRRSRASQDQQTSDQTEKPLLNLNNGYPPLNDLTDVKPGVHHVTGNFAEASAGSGETNVVVVTSTRHPHVLSPQAAVLVQDLQIMEEARRQFLTRLRLIQKCLLQKRENNVIMVDVKTGREQSVLTCAFLGVTDSCLSKDLTSKAAQDRYPTLS